MALNFPIPIHINPSKKEEDWTRREEG